MTARRFRVARDRSGLEITARSDLHPIRGHATGLDGELTVNVADHDVVLADTPRGYIALEAAGLTSGSRLQDLEMRRRIDAGRYPRISAELRSVTADGGTDALHVVGDLTLRGVTRQIPAQVRVTLDGAGDETMVVDGALTLDVRDFGITPPRLLGLRVDPEVQVTMHLVFVAR